MKLYESNYFSAEADRFYFSNSQFKKFVECEAQAVAKLNGEYAEPQSDALLVGSYVHAAIEGAEALEQFKALHPEIVASSGKNKGELKEKYQQADKMVNTLLSDPLCVEMLKGWKEQIVTAELFGVPWKAKIDIYAAHAGRIVDVKTTESLRKKIWIPAEARYGSFVEAYGYTTQMALYSEIERIYCKRTERLEPFIVAVSKEDEPDKAIVMFDAETLERELLRVQAMLPRIIEVKHGEVEPHRCERCRFCRSTKKAEIVHYASLLDAI